MAVPKVVQPGSWKPDRNDNAGLKRELDACEKENRSLDNLSVHIGEAVIHHVKNTK
jgi:hypothetical protein